MEKFDYVIVGSGIAGLHSAYRLTEQNKKVLVLESESYIGGRMSSHEINGNFVDFGAKFVANAYRNMLPLAKELGVVPVPIGLTRAAIFKEGKLYSFDDKKRFFGALLYKGISLKAKLQLGFAVLYALIKYRGLNIYDRDAALYLDNKSIYDDFRNFAGSEGFDHLLEPLSQNVVFYPTRDFSRAAFYSLLSKIVTMKTFTFPRGIGELCEKMAAQVQIEKNVKVRSVRKTEDGIVITALREGKEVTYQTENVILAIPGNRVLDILENPSSDEKEFFSHIRYASTVQILCEGVTNLFNTTNVIWTLPKEESNFTALGNRGREGSSANSTYFIAALRENTFMRLREANALDSDHLRELILKEFPNISGLKIIRVQVWESATPKLYPGYITSVDRFLKRPDWNSGIYFCGDYLENPSTEGALTSSIRLLEKINAV